MSTTAEDYVAKRAELLAKLVLTRREGVEVVRSEDPDDSGLHLVAFLPSISDQSKLPFLPCVGVEVMGTDEPLESEDTATAYVREHWEDRERKGFSFRPVVLLLFSMEGDKGYFGWLMEPRVGASEGPTLTRVFSPAMTKITKPSTESIFRASEAWSEAMVKLVVRDAKSK